MKKFNVLTDKKYLEIVANIESTLNEIPMLYRKGMRKDVAIESVQPKLDALKTELKQYVIDKERELLNNINSFQEVNKEYDNPTQELLRRQDFTARLGLMSDHEFIEYVSGIDTNELNVHDFNLINEKYNKLDETSRNALMQSITTLKESVLYPHANNEEYQQLQDDYSTLNNITTKHDGNPWLLDDAGNPMIFNVDDQYNALLKEYK